MARKVIVRSKPAEDRPVWEILNGKTLRQESEDFEADSICTPDQSHADLYANHFSESIASVTHGYDVTILAYGLPKSGKTYSVMGTPGQVKSNPEAKGIIARCMEQLVQQVQGNNKASTVTCSYCLITNDGRIKDLFDLKKRNLKVEEKKLSMSASGSNNTTKGVGSCSLKYFINGCTQEKIKSTDDVMRLVGKANLMRNATGVVQQSVHSARLLQQPGRSTGNNTNVLTQYKPHSNHAVFQYNIEHIHDTSSGTDPEAAVSTITIIDLAGHCIEQYYKESISNDVGINALHQVLDMVSNGNTQEASTVAKSTPLTSLLYSSLFGNSKCLVISTLSMDDFSTITKQALQLSLAFKNVSNVPSPISVPSSSLNIGKVIKEINTLKSTLIKNCTGSNKPGLQIIPIGYASVKIDGKNYDDLDEESTGMLNRYVDLQEVLIGYGNSSITEYSNTEIDSPPKVIRPALTPSLTTVAPPIKAPAPIRTNVDAISTPIPVMPSSLSQKPTPSTSLFSNQSLVNQPTTALQLPLLKSKPLLVSPTVLNQSLSSPPLLQSVSTGQLGSPIISGQKGSQKLPNLNTPLNPPSILKPEVKPKEETSSSDSDSDDQEESKKPVPPSRSAGIPNSSIPAPPPLNAIPHVKPLSASSQTSTQHTSQTQLKQEEPGPAPAENNNKENLTTSKTTEAKTNHTTAIPVAKHLNKQDGRRTLNTPSSSSLSSVETNRPAKSQKKKKMKKKRSRDDLKAESSLPSTLFRKPSGDDSSTPDEDTFDPNFRPGKLIMRPNIVNAFAGNNQFSRASYPIPIQQQFQPTAPLVHVSQHRQPYDANQHQLYDANQRQPYDGLNSQYMDQWTHQQQLLLAKGVPPLNQQRPTASTQGSDHQNEPDSNQINQTEEDHEIHSAAMYGTKASYLKELVMTHGVDFTDKYKRTPLMFAVIGNQPKMCEVLLGCNANVNAINSSGDTPILLATIHANVKIMKILLKAGANVTRCDENGRSVFHWAMQTPNINCLKTLCNFATLGMENKPNHEGVTPLHYAVITEQSNHIRTLLKLLPNAEVNPVDPKGRTPLNYAVLNFSPICIQALIESRGSDPVQYRDQYGRTPLHYACAEGSADCIRALTLCQSCNIHAQDNDGRTPLHWAAVTNQAGIVQLLLRRNADRGHTDKNDMTALDYAQDMNHDECVKILQNFGLRRPSSTWSIASQFAIRPSTPPELDQTGHIPIKQLRTSKWITSLFNRNNNTADRLPGDGGDAEPSPNPDDEESVRGQTAAMQDSIDQAPKVGTVTVGEATVTNSQQHQECDTSQLESIDGNLTRSEEPNTAQTEHTDDDNHHHENVIEATGDDNSSLREIQTIAPRHSHMSNNRILELFTSCIPRRNNTIHPNVIDS